MKTQTFAARALRTAALAALILLPAACLEKPQESAFQAYGDVVPAKVNKVFETYQYLPIYRGLTPPDITGKYLVSPNKCLWPGNVEDLRNHHIQFYGQKNNVVGLSFAEIKTDNSGFGFTFNTGQASLMGYGDYFTLYVVCEVNANSGFGDNPIPMLFVCSGKKTSAGIEGFRHAFMSMEKDIDSNYETLQVYKDEDGLASKQLF